MSDSYQVPVGVVNQGNDVEASQPTINETYKVEVVPREGAWQSYEDTKYDSPVINRLVPCRLFYLCRWKILAIFHTRLPFGFVLGELLFFLLLVGGLAAAFAVTGSGQGEDAAEATGGIACIAPALAFAFACRNSVWILFTGLPFERALLWHKVCAYLSVIGGVWHGIVSNEANVSGIVLTAVMGALGLFSLWPIRRKLFEAFLRLHWILFLVVIGAAFWHEAGVIVFGVAFWVVDVILRTFIAAWNYHKRKQVLAVRLPSNVIRLAFLKEDFKYKAGQYVFICVPGVSWFEWHPFSISSSPHENKVSVHIRVLGDWTKRLYDFVETTKMINIYIDGPYGAPCLDIDCDTKYEHFIFISGGIGITPMQSICNDLLHQCRRGRDLTKVIFVWSVRDLYMVTSVLEYDKEYFNKDYDNRLPYSFSPDLLIRDAPKEKLETFFHLTRERDTSKFSDANIHPEIQTNLKFGRPNLPMIFERMKGLCGQNKKRVAVLTCGPGPLVDSTYKLCVEHSSGGVTFDFHKEVFEF